MNLKASLIILAAFASAAQARWLTKDETGSVIEKFHVAYEVSKTGASTQTVTYVIRVQAEDGKSTVSPFGIDYNSVADQVEILEAATINGRKKFPVDPAAIEDRDKSESKDYDTLKTRYISFPQVQIGSKISIKYRVRTSKPIVVGQWSTEVTIVPSYFIEDFQFDLKSELPVHYELQDPRSWLKVTRSTPSSLNIKNKTALPAGTHAEKDPFFHPDGLATLRISSNPDWHDFLKPLEKDYAAILQQDIPKPLNAWIEQAKRKKSTTAKLEFLLEKMSTDFRYFGDWRRHEGGVIPRSLQEIEQSRYGDCKDLSTLLTAMLRKLNLKADVALVRRGENPWGEEPDYKLPVLFRFNHAIVHVQDGDKSYWLDPTNPVGSVRADSDIAGRPSWLVTQAKFQRIPALQAKDFDNVQDYEYLVLGADRTKVIVSAKMRQMAAAQVANSLLMAPRSEVLNEVLESFSEDQEIRTFKFLKEPSTKRVLHDVDFKLEYETGRLTYSAGKNAFWVMPNGLLEGAFLETDDRESDLALSEDPYVLSSARRLKKMKLAQEKPGPCAVTSKWLDLERKVEVEGDDVVIYNQVALKRPYIRKEEFTSGPFKALQEGAKRCFHRSGVLIEARKD